MFAASRSNSRLAPNWYGYRMWPRNAKREALRTLQTEGGAPCALIICGACLIGSLGAGIGATFPPPIGTVDDASTHYRYIGDIWKNHINPHLQNWKICFALWMTTPQARTCGLEPQPARFCMHGMKGFQCRNYRPLLRKCEKRWMVADD